MKKNIEDEVCLCRTIPCPKKFKKLDQKKELSEFVHYVAEEIEIACGAGTDSRLVLCAEKGLLKELRKQLSGQVRQIVIGTIELAERGA